MKRWYIVQVYAGFEETVKADLERRIALEGKDLFGDVLVPTGEAALFWGEEESKKEKIFPGYALIQMEMTSKSYNLVMETPKIYKFLGGENPFPLSENEVQKIFNQISGKLQVSGNKLPFGVGNEVHIASGPFSGFVGLVDKIDEEHEKITVMVSIFGRLTPVELDFNQIKK